MSPETIETVVVSALTFLLGGGGVHAWNKRKTDKFLKLNDMLLTVGEHEAICRKLQDERAKAFGLEIRVAIQDGFKDAAVEVFREIEKIKDEQRRQADRIERIKETMGRSYGAHHIASTIEPG